MPPADTNHHPALTTILFQLIFTCESSHPPHPLLLFPHLFPSGHQRSKTPCSGSRCQELPRSPRKPNDSHRSSLQPSPGAARAEAQGEAERDGLAPGAQQPKRALLQPPPLTEPWLGERELPGIATLLCP